MDRMTDIPVRKDQQITGKKRKYVSSYNQPQIEKYVRRRQCSYFRMGRGKII